MYERGAYYRDENGNLATRKAPGAALIYGLDLSDEVEAFTTEENSATVSSYSIAASEVTVVTSNLDENTIIFKISGGDDGDDGHIRITYTITAGDQSITDVKTIHFNVRND